MYKLKKAAAILCSAVMFTVLPGCGVKNNDSSSGEMITMSREEIESSLSYRTEKITIPDSIRLTRKSTFLSGNGIFFAIDSKENISSGNNKITLIGFDSEKILFETVISDISEIIKNETVCDCFVNSDNSVTALIEGENGGKSVRAVTVSSEGTVLKDLDISGNFQDKKVSGIAASEDGEFFVVTANSAMSAFSSDGVFEYEAAVNGIPDQLIGTNTDLVSSGDPAVSFGYLDGKDYVTKICVLDRKRKKFGKAAVIEGNDFFKGSGKYNYYIISDTGITGVCDNGNTEFLINLLNLGINNSDVSSIQAFEDGSFILGIHNVFDFSDDCFIRVVPADASNANNKTVITLGCFELPGAYKEKISEFNRENDDYVVVVSSFSENTDDDAKAMIDFNNQLITGHIPDIVIINKEMPFDGYIRKGLFADLYPFLDNDSDVSRSSFFESTLKAGENNGKLYSMFPTFGISTFAAKGSLVKGEKLITMSRAKELLTQMGDDAAITTVLTRSDALLEAVRFSGFIDFENGTSNFACDEFAELLTELKKMPETPEQYDTGSPEYIDSQLAYRNGKTIAMPFSSWGFLYSYRIKLIFDGDVSYINFPTYLPESNCIIESGSRLAISEQSENKEGAWEFVKYSMTHNLTETQYFYYNSDGEEIMADDRDYYSISGFPSYIEEYDILAENALKPSRKYDENGNMIAENRREFFAGEYYEIETLTDAEVAGITDLIKGAVSADKVNSQIAQIISEESEVFFHGDTDAVTAAKNIQSRMDIYMSEYYS